MMQPIAVVTYNLRVNTPYDGENSFENRKDLVRRKLLASMPDILCFQEALPDMFAWLRNILGNSYDFVGFGRMADFGDEANPIFFRRDRFRLHGFEQIWLSDAPYKPGSRFPGQSPCPRICVCAELKPFDGEPFRVFNTHLDHPFEAENIRLAEIEAVFRFISEQNQKCSKPFILTGDFNAKPDSKTLCRVRENCSPTVVDITGEIPVTYHAYGKEPPEKIDYIIVPKGTSCGDVSAWTDFDGVHYLSDHYPVEAEIIAFSEK